jgi:cell division protein FtsB
MSKVVVAIASLFAFLPLNTFGQMSDEEAQQRLAQRMATATQPDSLTQQIDSLKETVEALQAENQRLKEQLAKSAFATVEAPKPGWSIERLRRTSTASINPTDQYFNIGLDGQMQSGEQDQRVSVQTNIRTSALQMAGNNSVASVTQDTVQLKQVRLYCIIINNGHSVSLNNAESDVFAAFDAYDVFVDVDNQRIVSAAKVAFSEPDGDMQIGGDSGYDVADNSGKTVHVNGYFRSNGTYVNSYYRSSPSR